MECNPLLNYFPSSINLTYKDNCLLFSKATPNYLTINGSNRENLFFSSSKRAMDDIINSFRNQHLADYSTKCASKFRDWLLKKDLKKSSIQRIFNTVQAIYNLNAYEHDFNINNPFTKAYIFNDEYNKKEYRLKKRIFT